VCEQPPGELAYRVAELEPIAQSNVLEIDLSEQRERLTYLFNDGPLARVCLARQFRSLLERSGACLDINRAWSTPDIVDLMAFTLLDDVVAKQHLLADGDVRRRVQETIAQVERIAMQLPKVSTASLSAVHADYRPGHPEMN
jgi:hypothetical protein